VGREFSGGPVARRIEEEEFCPRIFTDWHGLLDEGLIGGLGYVFLLLSY
jgi:hypothetical protein